MNSTIVKKENNEVTLKIEVSAEIFEKSVEKAYNKMKGRFNIAGFRKGKSPRKLIQLHYGEGVFYDEAINDICPIEFTKAVKEYNLEPVDKPSLDIIEIGSGKKLVFTATVTVKPEVTLGEYKGIEVEKKEYNVKEEDVVKELEALREKNARLISVERAVQDGDTVIIDYAGFADEEQFEGGTAQKQTLEIGSGKFIPGFEEQLIGANPGEDREVKVIFPEEYHAENLAGKEAVFKTTVHEVKEKELPQLDDEFAKDVSDKDTLEALKTDIWANLEKTAKVKAERELKDAVIEKIVGNTQLEIPEIMIEHEIDVLINDFNYQLQYQGLNLDTYFQYTNSKMENLRSQMKNDAQNRIKTRLILESIANLEKIEVSDEEMDSEILKYATQYKAEVDEFKKSLTPEDFNRIKEGIKIRKTVDFLVENAKMSA